MKYKLLKDLPGIDAGNILYQEEVGNMELYIKQMEVGLESGFKVWKTDGIEVNKLRDGLNYIIECNIGDKEWFEKI